MDRSIGRSGSQPWTDESVYASHQARAGGFPQKDVPDRGLAEAVRSVAAGESLLAVRLTRGIIERFAAQHPADKELQKRAELLSDRARDLALLGKGLANAEIGERPFVSEATVKTHVPHIHEARRSRPRSGDRIRLRSWADRARVARGLGDPDHVMCDGF